MKRLLILLLLGFAAWKGYEHFFASAGPAAAPPPAAARAVDGTPVARQSAFRCDGRQHCSQMNSRAEAEFFVRNCPDTKMDGDRDGEPCENDSRF